MKKGLLVYEKSDAERNRWFIDALISKGLSHDLDISLSVIDNDHCSVPIDGLSFCINRSRIAAVSRAFEDAGLLSVNNSATVRIGNDKWETYLFCKEHSFPVMPTKLLSEDSEPVAFPAVLKEVSGHGGNEVFMVDSEDEIRTLKQPHKSYIIQHPCDTVGLDVRVYVIGKRAVFAAKRSSETDFRSNFSLGGKAEIFEPPDEMRKTAEAIAVKLDSAYIGVDFIRDAGRWIVNEIEDAAGARMVYSLSPETDIAELYIREIKKRTEV